MTGCYCHDRTVVSFRYNIVGSNQVNGEVYSLQLYVMWRGVLDTNYVVRQCVLDATFCDVASCTRYHFMLCRDEYSIQRYVMWRGALDATLGEVAKCTGYNYMWCDEAYSVQLYVKWRGVLDTNLCDVARRTRCNIA
jgi:hypothetical protein